MNARFLSIAARELSETIDYYESLVPGLGERCRTEVEITLARIRRNPSAWAPFGDGLRRCRSTRFPYGLIYAIEADSIVIVAVANLHRDPEQWHRRPRG